VQGSSVPEGTTVTVQLVGTDDEPGALTYVLDAAPAGATVDANGKVTWLAADGLSVGSFSARAVDAQGAASAAVNFAVSVTNVAPILNVTAPEKAVVGEPFTLSLKATDPGADTVQNWLIQWGDGTQSTVAGAASGVATIASHTYTLALANAAIVVRAVDDDGTWTAPTLTRAVTAAPAPAQRPRGDDRDDDGRDKERERDRRESDSRPRRSPERERESDRESDASLGVRVVDQSVHRGSRALAVVVAEGQANPPQVGAGAGAVLSADAMQSLLETNPTGAGVPTNAVLQISTIVATDRGIRVRFNQAISAAALAAAGDALIVMRGDQIVTGTVVVDPDGEGMRFDAASGEMPAGEYQVTLRTDSGAFVTPDGVRLDGDYDGQAGGDYRGRFTISVEVEAAVSPARAVQTAQVGDHSTGGGTGPQAVRAFAERFAVLYGGWGGVVSLALGPAALRRRSHGGRGLLDTINTDDTDVPVVLRDQVDASALKFAVQPMVPAAMAAVARQKSSNNNWEIRL